MDSESHHTTDGDIAHIRVTSGHRPVRSQELERGLRDSDEQIRLNNPVGAQSKSVTA